MREKKTSKGQVITIVLLSLLLVANISYVVCDKFVFSKKEVKEEKSEKEKVEKKEDVIRSLSLAEEKMLLEQIDGYNTYLSMYYPIEDVASLTNQQILLFAYHTLDKKNPKELMQSDIKKRIEYYFGKDNNVVYESIVCDHNDGELYTYDNTTKVFTRSNTHGHDGGESYKATVYYLDGKVKNEVEYTIRVQMIYDRYCGGTCGPALKYYKNAKDAKSDSNPVIEREEERELTDVDYEKVKNELETTTFQFKKDTKGNYGLVSVMNKG